ncbi:hypothetical protein MAHJHV50_49890 [Mycobacterium avium subsp. hominissuis]
MAAARVLDGRRGDFVGHVVDAHEEVIEGIAAGSMDKLGGVLTVWHDPIPETVVVDDGVDEVVE